MRACCRTSSFLWGYVPRPAISKQVLLPQTTTFFPLSLWETEPATQRMRAVVTDRAITGPKIELSPHQVDIVTKSEVAGVGPSSRAAHSILLLSTVDWV